MNLINRFSRIIFVIIFFCLMLCGCNNTGIDTANQQVIELQIQLEKLQNENESLKTEIDTLNDEIEESTRKYKEIYESFLDKGEDVIIAESKVRELNDKNRELEGNIDGLKNELNMKIGKIWQYKKLLQKNKKELQDVIKPNYILNIYDPILIQENDEIAGLIVEHKNVRNIDGINIPIYEEVAFTGEYQVKGRIYHDKENELVSVKIDQSELINIPVPIDNFYIKSFEITVLNGDELINLLGDKYVDGIEVIARFSGFKHYGKIEAEKMTETTFSELMSISNDL